MGSKTPKIFLHNHIKIKGIKIVGSKTQKKHQEHSILSTNLHQDINWSAKQNNIVFIIVKENYNSINILK